MLFSAFSFRVKYDMLSSIYEYSGKSNILEEVYLDDF